MTTTYTDHQACIVASVDGGPFVHRKTIEAWAAQDAGHARSQREYVRRDVRTEVGPGARVEVRIVPGYCAACQGLDGDAKRVYDQSNRESDPVTGGAT